MCKGVAVTGIGIISAIGNNVEENLNSLCASRNGLSTAEILKTIHTQLPLGEIKSTNTELARQLNLNKDHSYTRAALLGTLALKELLSNLNLEQPPKGTGFISGTTVGGIDATEQYYKKFDNNIELRKYIKAQHPGYTTQKIAEYFNLNSLVTTITTACSSGANAIMQGARLIQTGKADRVIVGGTDCLSKFTLNGFNSLKILSDKKTRAFDANRDGLNLGEGAAYLMLESEKLVNESSILARLTGYGNANDAFHQTASSDNGEGAYLAMKKSLEKAKLNISDIDYINAHGTGTLNNDLAESIAIKRLFTNKVPSFSSTKAFTGHTLAASGAIEAVFSVLNIQHQTIFPNLNFHDKMAETELVPVLKLKPSKIDSVLSNSFGFGGNCTTLIFQKA